MFIKGREGSPLRYLWCIDKKNIDWVTRKIADEEAKLTKVLDKCLNYVLCSITYYPCKQKMPFYIRGEILPFVAKKTPL